MRKQTIGTAPFDLWSIEEPLIVPVAKDHEKTYLRLRHPRQAEPEGADHVVSYAPMSWIPDLLPWVERGSLLRTRDHADAPLPLPPVPRVHIFAIGDVGAHCALGLRLLGGADLQIGVYAREPESAQAFATELGQVRSADLSRPMPDVYAVSEENVLDCDVLVFAAAAGVPKTLAPGDDVRMMQYHKNRAILDLVLERIRTEAYPNYLAILSDPVDALCAHAARTLDGALPRDRIFGLGLGVMAARAAYYAPETAPEYPTEGRAYGPHGEGLWVANSLRQYDDERSLQLTEQAKTANLAIRALGAKPFYGPSLSSGSYSLLSFLRGEWFYTAVAMDGIFLGCRARHRDGIWELEYNDAPEPLCARVGDIFEILRAAE